MKLLDKIRRVFKRAPVRGQGTGSRRRVRGKYDAAQTTAENRRHWANADGLSADAANALSVRKTLRNRSRYEVANNSWLRGMINTLAEDTVGLGPKLQMQTDNVAANTRLEAQFHAWTRAVRLAQKLRLARMAMAVDGETFLLLVHNPAVKHAVKLDILPIECDRVTDPFGQTADATQCDGILYDAYGNPREYRILADHPGAHRIVTRYGSYTPYYPHQVIHLYRMDRPGQRRGIPETTPSLEVIAMQRRYSKAALAAAENAAENAGWLYTDAPANSEDLDVAGESFEELEIQRNMWTVAPYGYKAQHLKAEQPTTTYDDFLRRNINESARPWSMPLNVALCDSSSYNYASGRLDHQTYDRGIAVIRSDLELDACDPILDEWVRWAVLIEGYLPARFRNVDPDVSHVWMWTNRPHVDPQKEAWAQEKRLLNQSTTLADEYARSGQDWEAQLRQRHREMKLQHELARELKADDEPVSSLEGPDENSEEELSNGE